MADYNVRVYPSAQKDLWDMMRADTSLNAEEAAQRFKVIKDKLNTLASAPESYRMARDTLLRLRGYRTMQLENHVAFFTVSNGEVELRRVLPTRRQFSQLL